MDNELVTPAGVGIPLNLNNLRAHIAAELAAGLSNKETVCDRYGISSAQWDVLRSNPTFVGMLKEQLQVYRGDNNAATRIKIKSNVALEDSIPDIYSMIGDNEVAASAQIEAAKLLANLGGALGKDSNKDAAAVGSGFSINIMLGEKPVSIVGTNGTDTQTLQID